VLYTELGYEQAFWPDGVSELGVRELLALAGGGITLGDALLFPATLGAPRAFLELRALEGERIVARSDWIELTWAPELLATVR
jgi:hypothetical protein